MNKSSNLSCLRKRSKANNDVAKGAYLLILWLSSSKDVTIGKLGTFFLASGFYAYVGSAMGAAGFKRVSRHVEVSSGDRKIQKWHVDYLLTISQVIKIVKIETRERIECWLARKFAKNSQLDSIKGFGSSDCTCYSHLFYSPRLNDLEDATRGLIYSMYREKTIISVTIQSVQREM